jgi:hypothetical protein
VGESAEPQGIVCGRDGPGSESSVSLSRVMMTTPQWTVLKVMNLFAHTWQPFVTSV